MSQIKFVTYCRPQPQGSTRAFIAKGKWGAADRAIVTSDNKNLKPYRDQVTQAAMAALGEAGFQQPMAAKHVPVAVVMDFYLEKPPSVPKKRSLMVVKPDLSKLVRSTEDSLIGILYADDAQIVEAVVRKHYGVPERVEVSVTILEGKAAENNDVPLFGEGDGENKYETLGLL
jgi:Holliday junction resolvase RusA-like endonuclease